MLTKERKNGVKEGRLSDKERRFCLEYMLNPNQRQAAIAAGYSEKTAGVTASKVMKRKHIIAFLGKHQRLSREKFQIDTELVLSHLLACATRDGKDFVDDDGRLILESQNLKDVPSRITQAINSIRQKKRRYRSQETGEMEEEIETIITLVDKGKAMEMVMRHKGLFAPTEIHSTNLNLDWDKLAAGKVILGTEDDPIEAVILKEINKGENKCQTH